MHPHVLGHGRLALQPRAAQLTLVPSLRFVHRHVLLELRADAEVLPADFALVLVREVDRVLVPVHLPPVDKHEVALGALDVHGLLLVLQGDVLPEVGPAEERVAAQVADEVLGHWESLQVSLVHLLVPK